MIAELGQFLVAAAVVLLLPLPRLSVVVRRRRTATGGNVAQRSSRAVVAARQLDLLRVPAAFVPAVVVCLLLLLLLARRLPAKEGVIVRRAPAVPAIVPPAVEGPSLLTATPTGRRVVNRPPRPAHPLHLPRAHPPRPRKRIVRRDQKGRS